MKFTFTFFALASLAISGYASTVADIKADITKIGTQVNSLNTAIAAFANPGGTLAQALAIHTAAQNVINTLKSSTTDAQNVTPKPVSETDGRAVLTQLEGLEPAIDKGLVDIVIKKPAFLALPIGGLPALVKQDLIGLNTNTNNFETTLLASTPADLQSEARALATRINAAFATAIAAYS